MTDAVIPLRKRRTYLDECRARGVFQKHEELLAENSDLKSQLMNREKIASAEVHSLTAYSLNATAFAEALQASRNEMQDRAAMIFDAFAQAELGIEYLPLLRHVLINTDTPGGEALGLFRAAAL